MVTQRAIKKALTLRGQQTRAVLLTAAEEIFARRGLHRASVAQLAQRAGVATGTFYVHFESKEALFLALVEDLGARLEQHVREHTAKPRAQTLDSRQVLEAFLDFVVRHPHLYRLVRQSEELDADVYRDFYRRLSTAWQQVLTDGMRAGEVTRANPEVLSWVLMGVLHFVGMRFVEWAHEPAPVSDALLDEVTAFVEAGLRGERAPRASSRDETPTSDEGYSFFR